MDGAIIAAPPIPNFPSSIGDHKFFNFFFKFFFNSRGPIIIIIIIIILLLFKIDFDKPTTTPGARGRVIRRVLLCVKFGKR